MWVSESSVHDFRIWALFSPFQPILESVGALSVHFGVLWGLFGPFWGPLGPFRSILESAGALSAHSGALCDPFGHFRPIWAISGSFWGFQAWIWAIFGSFWGFQAWIWTIIGRFRHGFGHFGGSRHSRSERSDVSCIKWDLIPYFSTIPPRFRVLGLATNRY